MSIRLSKACKELNIGMTTAVEFFAKKGHKIVVDPNLKLSDDLHLLLAKEFDKDMALKIESERLSQERHLKDKAETVALEGYNQSKPVDKPAETIHVTISEDQLPHFKSVGHIDLDTKDKHVEKKPEVKVQIPVVEKPKVAETAKPVVEKVVEEKEIIKPQEVKETVITAKTESHKEAEVGVSKPETQAKEEKIIPTTEESKDQVKVIVEESKVVVEPKIEIAKPAHKKEVQVTEVIEKIESVGNVETEHNDHEEDEVFSLVRPTLDKAPVVIGTIN